MAETAGKTQEKTPLASLEILSILSGAQLNIDLKILKPDILGKRGWI